MTGRPGLFLAFEGVEGAGKSTQVAALAEWLRQRGADVVVAREPGSTPLGERVRDTVLGARDVAIPARSELFLMLAARAAFVDQVVEPALASGSIVIADRFELSTLAYQGVGRGLPLDEVRACNRFATLGVQPDATVLLVLDPAEGARRQGLAEKSLDRMERETSQFHERVGLGYAELAGSISGVLRVSGDGSVADVADRILLALRQRFPETFGMGGFMSSRAPDSTSADSS